MAGVPSCPASRPWRSSPATSPALLDRLGVGEFVLAGLSMGGQIVLEFHRLFADRVRALVLADTFAQAETEDGRKARNAMADRLLAEGMDGYAEEALPLMVAPRTIERGPRWRGTSSA